MERITFEVTSETKEKLKIRAVKHKNLKEYMTILLENHLNENESTIDFEGLKEKIVTDMNNIENKIKTEKQKFETNDFIELIFLKGQLSLINLLIEMGGN